MKNIIGKKVFVLEKDNAMRLFSSNYSNMSEEKIIKKHGPFVVLDYFGGFVIVEIGLGFKQLSIQDIELATPLTESLAE